METSATPRPVPTMVANWKMHKLLAEARALAIAVRDGCRELSEVRVVLCPPFTALATVAEVLQGSHLTAGPLTGEVSTAQVADAGARVVILGHSERRQHFGETDAAVHRKVGAALAH